MNRTIDAAILKAIRVLVNSKTGGQSEVARLTGITQKQVSNYVSGKTQRMSAQSWRRLYPVLKNFLPPEYINQNDSLMQGSFRGDAVSREHLIETILRNEELDDRVKLRVIGIINKA